MQQPSGGSEKPLHNQPHPNDQGKFVPAPEEGSLENIGVAQPDPDAGAAPGQGGADGAPQDRDGQTRRIDSPQVTPPGQH